MTVQQSIPLVCILPEPQLVDRKQEILRTIVANVQGKRELEDGFAFEFSAEFPLQTLVDFISAERACCPFFTFDLSVAPGNLCLNLRGPEGVKTFINELFFD